MPVIFSLHIPLIRIDSEPLQNMPQVPGNYLSWISGEEFLTYNARELIKYLVLMWEIICLSCIFGAPYLLRVITMLLNLPSGVRLI